MTLFNLNHLPKGLPGGSEVKNPPTSAGDTSSIPGLGRSPGEGNGYPLQYSCLGNPMDREPGGLQWSHEESDMTEQLNGNNRGVVTTLS